MKTPIIYCPFQLGVTCDICCEFPSHEVFTKFWSASSSSRWKWELWPCVPIRQVTLDSRYSDETLGFRRNTKYCLHALYGKERKKQPRFNLHSIRSRRVQSCSNKWQMKTPPPPKKAHWVAEMRNLIPHTKYGIPPMLYRVTTQSTKSTEYAFIAHLAPYTARSSFLPVGCKANHDEPFLVWLINDSYGRVIIPIRSSWSHPSPLLTAPFPVHMGPWHGPGSAVTKSQTEWATYIYGESLVLAASSPY